MKILIMDDDPAVAAQLEIMCRGYLEKKQIDAELRMQTKYIPERDCGFQPDILILDIEMPGMSGLEIKRLYEERRFENPDLWADGPYIIFVSSHIELMSKSFGPYVMAFLPKPVQPYGLKEALETTIRYVHRNDLIDLDGGRKIAAGNIITIRSDHIYTKVLTAGGETISIRRSLSEWERMLPGDFIRISNSCIAGCKWIREINGTSVVLKDGWGIVAVSRRSRKTCVEQFQKYCERMQKYV